METMAGTSLLDAGSGSGRSLWPPCGWERIRVHSFGLGTRKAVRMHKGIEAPTFSPQTDKWTVEEGHVLEVTYLSDWGSLKSFTRGVSCIIRDTCG